VVMVCCDEGKPKEKIQTE